ncbi:MAG: YicC family protein [Planctomycetales bacterium]|nr:YicC family protein [Planctomycetales bacterium]NIM08960.1 YicC family protein [Planctomycetales bacterium]NIN08423.1 YicC family protein [Planctomycetales bacterium]NIN77552.1 YicC family protein [Planctomycetales bacterium]NIO34722.1 YicC family protein [Planctomycetales bacterium]
MLLSMTGFGEAARQNELLVATVEVRTINNRYLKISTRCSDGCPTLDPQIDGLVRQHVKRGTVQVNVRIQNPSTPDQFRINEEVLDGYRQQLQKVQQRWQGSEPLTLDALLLLPGVVDDRPPLRDTAEVWPLVQTTLTAALENLTAMRRSEGQAMAADLTANLQLIEKHLQQVQSRAPRVVEAYRQKLGDRISQWLQENRLDTQPVDLLREVSLFAERSDISEECVRLQSHIDQFRTTIQQAEVSGRRLDFLTQEMFRETNTIGSKGNDADISQQVIEIKTVIERIREMVQNIE